RLNRSLHCVLIQFPFYVSLIITFSISCVTVLCKVAVACSVDDVEGLDTENDMLSSLFGVGSVYVSFSLAAIPLARRDTVNGHLLRSPGSLRSGIYESLPSSFAAAPYTITVGYGSFVALSISADV
ncbi:hypothetical protein BDQ17DRAFT_1376085, partial [Cyathus striatus]